MPIRKSKFGNLTIIELDPGKNVNCDLCNKDYTNDSETKGGFLFSGKAICPECEPRIMVEIKKYHEERFIRAKAMPDESFRDFVYRIRETV